VAHVDPLVGRVEVGEIAGLDVDRPERQTGNAVVDAVEVDEALERVAQRGRVVIAECGLRSRQLQPRRRHARREEAGGAEQQRARGAGVVHGADRDPGHPAGPQPGVVQGLEHTALVGAEGAASLQDEDGFLVSFAAVRRRNVRHDRLHAGHGS
jgi:hypothetical protein